MKTVLLTTYTSHHLYFLKKICEKFSIEAIINQKKVVRPQFEVIHELEIQRDNYEKEQWFKYGMPRFGEFAPVVDVDEINDVSVYKVLKEIKPEIVLVFGTSKIKKEIIDLCPKGMINLHGGDPEYYRGLDSHYWAIYHGDYPRLVTTLHRVDLELDTGDIIEKQRLPLTPGMKLYQLRKANTEACVNLVVNALEGFSRNSRFTSTRLNEVGRYYSHMPSVIKEICNQKFNRFTESL